MGVFVSLLVALVGIALLVVSAASFAKRRSRLVRVWETAARKLGLLFENSSRASWRNELSISGTLDGVPVRVQYQYHMGGLLGSRSEEKVSFHAGASDRIPASLSVQADTFMRSLGRLVQGRDEQIGDRTFDELVELPSMNAYVCAVLDARAREQLLALTEVGGAVRDGMVVCEQRWSDSIGAEWLVDSVGSFARLARALSVTPEELPERLSRNATADPSPGVRLQNLRFLIDTQIQAPPSLVTATARALLSDADPAVRLLAAKQLGSEGLTALCVLACDPLEATELRVDALHELRQERASELGKILPGLLSSSSPEVICAALSIISSRQLDSLSEAVVMSAGSRHDAVRVAAANALVNLSGPGREQTLVRLLGDASHEVQRVSAEALGLVGGAAAIVPLEAIAEAFGRAELRHAARAAIERIQGRLADPDAGHISLAEQDIGAMGVAALARAGVGDRSLVTNNVGSFGERKHFSWLPPPAPRKPDGR